MFVYGLCYEIDTDKLPVVWRTCSGPGWLVRMSLQEKASVHTISLFVRIAVLAGCYALQRLLPTPPTLSHHCSSPTLQHVNGRRSGLRIGATTALNTALPRCQQEMLPLKSSLRQRHNHHASVRYRPAHVQPGAVGPDPGWAGPQQRASEKRVVRGEQRSFGSCNSASTTRQHKPLHWRLWRR